jgi:hypothetical protein
VHLLLLDEPSAHHLIDRGFDKRGADRLVLPITLAEIRDEFLVVAEVVADIGLEFRHAVRQFLRWRGVLPSKYGIRLSKVRSVSRKYGTERLP